MNRQIVTTVDYEVFGNGSGNVRRHVIEPTERMCRIAERHHVPLTIFFELEEYLAFQRNAPELRRATGCDPAALMRDQAANLARRGHEIQLHLHPQWYRARRTGGGWDLEMDTLTVDALFETQEETTAYIRERQQQLEEISGRPVNAYRAGGFAAQPGTKLLHALSETGFKIDSSVVKGLNRPRPLPLDYRRAPADRSMWRISDEVTLRDEAGQLWEIPVHSEMGRRYQQLTWKRLKAKFSSDVPRSRQRDMVGELGVGRNPWSVVSFLAQPVPIKLDYHNLTPSALYRMIKRAPAPSAGEADVLVLIGHTKEHADDVAFDRFLHAVASDRELKVVTFSDVARDLPTRSVELMHA